MDGWQGVAAERSSLRLFRCFSDDTRQWVQKAVAHVPLLLSLGCTFFGPGLQSVSVLGWLQPVFQLYYMHVQSWKLWPLVWLVQTIGLSCAFLGSLNDPDLAGIGVAVSFGFSSIISLLLLFAYAIDVFFARRFETSVLSSLVFPTLYTSVYFVMTELSPVGTWANAAYSQIGWNALIQVVSLFGLSGVLFMMAWFASVMRAVLVTPPKITAAANRTVSMHFYLDEPIEYITIDVARTVVWTFAASFVAVLLYGGMRTATWQGRFFQTAINDRMHPAIKVSCILGQLENSSSFMLQSTIAEARDGARIVLWSETALLVENELAEMELLSNVSAIARRFDTHVGVTYQLQHPELLKLPNQDNVLALVGANGEVLFKYRKAHPVILVENMVTPGPRRIPFADTVYGRMGGAICFDFDFPGYLQQAGSSNIDIMLQPSWTWGPIGELHARSSALRAVEQGFTLFRCSSNGYSGIFSPGYDFHLWQPGLTEHIIRGQLITTPRVWTVYGLIGDLFAWLCIVFSLVYVALAVLPRELIGRILASKFLHWLPLQLQSAVERENSLTTPLTRQINGDSEAE